MAGAVPPGFHVEGLEAVQTLVHEPFFIGFRANFASESARSFLRAGTTFVGAAFSETLASAPTKVGGVNILSHFCYPSGIRQAALATKKSLECCGVATSYRDVPVDVASRTGERTDWLGLEIYPITLLTNAPIPHFVTAYERSGLFQQNNVYRIAYWYWELETIPEDRPLIRPPHICGRSSRTALPLPSWARTPKRKC